MLFAGRKKEMLTLFRTLNILCHDVDLLIIEYEPREWKGVPFVTWQIKKNVSGICSVDASLYLCCDWGFTTCNTKGQTSEESRISHASMLVGMDVDAHNSTLYAVNMMQVIVAPLHGGSLRRWTLPKQNGLFRGIKIDVGILYVSIQWIPEVFFCHPKTGQVLRKLNTQPHSVNAACDEVVYPAITVNNQHLYLCNALHNRVEVFKKKDGELIQQWTGSPTALLIEPRRIYVSDDTVYVGDSSGVQVFLKDGTCLQRIACGLSVCGLCLLHDRLYVAGMNRIEVFKSIN